MSGPEDLLCLQTLDGWRPPLTWQVDTLSNEGKEVTYMGCLWEDILDLIADWADRGGGHFNVWEERSEKLVCEGCSEQRIAVLSFLSGGSAESIAAALGVS